MLIGRAQNQFADLIDNRVADAALMERIIRLIDAPWDAWPVVGDYGSGSGAGMASASCSRSCTARR